MRSVEVLHSLSIFIVERCILTISVSFSSSESSFKMVRIVSQNFSPPRSRHSSGETDRDLAERTKLALSVLGRKRVETTEWESSSDSFWDSEFDYDQTESHLSEAESEQADINGNDPIEKSDPQSKRKQRRRERNKLSAQAYRQRRRHQSVKEKQQMMTLEFENKRLHKLVDSLEKKTEQAKQYLRGMQVPMPDILSPVGEEPSEGFEFQPSSEGAAALPSPSTKLNKNQFPCQHVMESPEPSVSQPLCPPFHNLNSPQACAQNVLVESPSSQSNSPTPLLPPPASAPSPVQPQILINTQGLLASTANENLNGAAANAVPTYVAVPIEPATTSQCFSSANLNTLANVNQGFTAVAAGNADGSAQPWLSQTTMIGAAAPQMQASAWNGKNRSAAAPLNGNAVFSIVKMEMCNNGNINITSNKNEGLSNVNLNDSNGNQNSFNTMTMKAINPHVVSFKINLNQAPGVHQQAADLRAQDTSLSNLSQGPAPILPEPVMRMHVQ